MKRLVRALTASILIALLCVTPPAVLAVESDTEAIETIEENDVAQPSDEAGKADAPSAATTDQPTSEESTFVTTNEEITQDEDAPVVADAAAEAPALSGSAHVQGLGWRGSEASGPGIALGTTGQSRRMEALTLRLSRGSVSYRVHGQGYEAPLDYYL